MAGFLGTDDVKRLLKNQVGEMLYILWIRTLILVNLLLGRDFLTWRKY